MQTWRIGDVTVTKIIELEAVGGFRFVLPQATREAVLPMQWLHPHFMDEQGRLKASIHTLVVQTPARRIVVDTCLGNDKQGRAVPHWNDRRALSWRILPRLASTARRSTPCSARTCTSTVSAGTPCWWTAAGCRRFRTRAI